MEHVLVRMSRPEDRAQMLQWVEATRDGDLFDADVLEHASTFVLTAFGPERLAHLPVQQPLMLENLIFRPGLREGSQKATAMTRLAEQAVSEAYRMDAGELYFLCRDETTCRFAERHKFKRLPDELKVYRLNLRETFGR